MERGRNTGKREEVASILGALALHTLKIETSKSCRTGNCGRSAECRLRSVAPNSPTARSGPVSRRRCLHAGWSEMRCGESPLGPAADDDPIPSREVSHQNPGKRLIVLEGAILFGAPWGNEAPPLAYRGWSLRGLIADTALL